MVRLKDEPNFPASQNSQLVFVQPRDILAIQQNPAGGRFIQARQQAEQGAFPAARLPHNRNKLSARNVEINAFQNIHAMGCGSDTLGETGDLDHRQGGRSCVQRIIISSVWVLAITLAGCSAPKQEFQNEPKSQPVTVEKVDPRPVVVAFGDSLTAGFGVEPGLSYPDFLQKEIDQHRLNWRVVNAGVSGDTTTDGANRIAEALAAKPKIVIVEFGGNDGLRGLPLETTRANLDQIVADLQKVGVQVVIAGMTLPPNYGPEYIHPFEQIYVELAKKYKVPRIRFLLEGVGGNPALMQRDGLHATAEGNAIVAENVFKTLAPLLR